MSNPQHSVPSPYWIVANFKMNGERATFASLFTHLSSTPEPSPPLHLILCPPFPYLALCQKALSETSFPLVTVLGAQDCSAHEQGSFTGEVSVTMLKEMGCTFALVGHSERRNYHQETDLVLSQKIHQALGHNIRPIVCVGEPLSVRQKGQASSFVQEQVKALLKDQAHSIQTIIVAYEPLWAIGTGITPTPEDLSEILDALDSCLRQELGIQEPIILYGGSVKPETIPSFLSCQSLKGFLVGKAVLETGGIPQLIQAFQKKPED